MILSVIVVYTSRDHVKLSVLLLSGVYCLLDFSITLKQMNHIGGYIGTSFEVYFVKVCGK